MLTSIRRGWGCDCGGERPGPKDAAVEAHRLKIRHYTGHDAPRTCPWRAYEDPTVHAVLALFSECQTPEGCTPALCMLQGDVPHAHWQGLLHYKSCLDSYRRKLHDEERDKR